MSKRTTILGTACVLGMALVAGPAAAATLTDYAGTLTTSFSSTSNSDSDSDTAKSWLLGGSVAGPLTDLMGMNFQADASYIHNWARDSSAEDWNLGGSAFWANMDSRVGVNVNYFTATRSGHQTSFGAFGEAYFGSVTAMAKGGFISSGGTPQGGHGNYMGAAIAGYVVPDGAITGAIDWADIVTGRGCALCGRGDVSVTAVEILAEYLFSEEYGLSGFVGAAYAQDHAFGFKTHDTTFHVGLRWYTGGGSLQDRQRNGNLNPWLPGAAGLRVD